MSKSFAGWCPDNGAKCKDHHANANLGMAPHAANLWANDFASAAVDDHAWQLPIFGDALTIPGYRLHFSLE